MNDAPMRADRSTSRVGRIWLDLEPRRGKPFLINIWGGVVFWLVWGGGRGGCVVTGGGGGGARGPLVGAIPGLLLSWAHLEGPLARRLRLTLMVAAGLAV